MKAEYRSILIVIPVYNHGETLRGVVEAALATPFPVLVVDDGSTDNGVASLEGLECQVERLGKNRGKGAAILTGARIARDQGFDAIITVDADGQHNPEDALKLADCLQDGGWPVMVIGARNMVQETVPGSSHFGRTFSNFWVRLECGAELADTQSGMRLYPTKAMLQLEYSRTRYDFEVEVLVKLVWAGISVRSVGVSVHYPPPWERISHFHKFVDNWRLTLLHTRLVCRRLLPIPHRRVVPQKNRPTPAVLVKRPLQTLRNLCRENASPFWLALAVWLGIVIGASPIFGLHTVTIIYFCYRLHLNKVAAVAASQLCMPPIVPALCIEVGYFLRTGGWLTDLSWERWLLEIHIRLWDWFVGFLLVGPVLGVLGGAIVYWVARKFQRNYTSSGTR